MRKSLAIVAACLIGTATPASAATLFNVSISGYVTGTRNTLACASSNFATCLDAYPSGFATSAYGAEFTRSLGGLELNEGENRFDYGHPRSSGSFSGIIVNQNGYLTGRDLVFYLEDSNLRFGVVGSSYITAGSTAFNVVGGVPEPTTWALMLLGFLAIGSALRQAPRRALQPA